MKTPNPHHIPILEAARFWVDRCLIHGDSVFTDEHIWTTADGQIDPDRASERAQRFFLSRLGEPTLEGGVTL